MVNNQTEQHSEVEAHCKPLLEGKCHPSALYAQEVLATSKERRKIEVIIGEPIMFFPKWLVAN